MLTRVRVPVRVLPRRARSGSRALVPHPEILRFRVPADGCQRVVLASDGLWDFVDASEVARLVDDAGGGEEATPRDLPVVASTLVQAALDKGVTL